MTYHLVIEIPGLPRTLNSRGHWRIGHAAAIKWHTDVAFACFKRLPPQPLERARLKCTRFSSMPMDHDNLVSGFKPLIDGLVRCGVLADDRWEIIGMPAYEWIQVPKKMGRVRIEVWGEDESISESGRNDIATAKDETP